MELKRSDFAPGVALPAPDEPIGWLVFDTDGKVVDWGPVTDLQMVASFGEPVGVDA